MRSEDATSVPGKWLGIVFLGEMSAAVLGSVTALAVSVNWLGGHIHVSWFYSIGVSIGFTVTALHAFPWVRLPSPSSGRTAYWVKISIVTLLAGFVAALLGHAVIQMLPPEFQI